MNSRPHHPIARCLSRLRTVLTGLHRAPMRRTAALLFLLVPAMPAAAAAQAREEPRLTPRPAPTAVLPKLTPLHTEPKGKAPVAHAPLLPLPAIAAPLSPVAVPGEPPPPPAMAAAPLDAVTATEPEAPASAGPVPTRKPAGAEPPMAKPSDAQAAKPPPPAQGSPKAAEKKAAGRTVHVKDGVFVRAVPSRDGKVLDTLEAGETVELLPGEDDDTWARVARKGKMLGYVARSYLAERPPTADSGDGCALPRDLPDTRGRSPLHEGSIARALADANIRRSPACNAPVLDVLEEGDTVTVTGITGTWYRVARKGRMLGYISTPLLGQAKRR